MSVCLLLLCRDDVAGFEFLNGLPLDPCAIYCSLSPRGPSRALRRLKVPQQVVQEAIGFEDVSDLHRLV